jgi:hypothetical protein
MLLPLLWRPRRALSYDVATWANTSSNQASKDPCQLRCGYSNLGKIYLSLDVGRLMDATKSHDLAAGAKPNWERQLRLM